MRYLFDCSFIWPEIRYMSIPTYAFRLLKALPNEVVSNSTVLVRSNMVSYFKDLNPHLNLIVVNYNKYISRVPLIGYRYNNWLYRRCIRSLDYECVLILDEQRNCNLFCTDRRKVAVFHDLKGIKGEKKSNIENYKYYDRLIKSSNALIAISEYTKQDILKYYHVDESKVNVVYNSISLPITSKKPDTFAPQKKYVLYVNSLHPYKNALTLVKAFNEIKDRYELDLVFVGSSTDYWEHEVMTYVRKHGLGERIVRLQDVSDEELKYFYEHATLFVTTSLHEGFGYTPIEAAICECPVISSTCEALPETTQNKLYYYEPAQSVSALRDKMTEVLENPPAKEKLKTIAKEFAADYNPEKQIAEILSVMNMTRSNE